MNWPKWPKHFIEMRPKNFGAVCRKIISCGSGDQLAVGAATFGERFIKKFGVPRQMAEMAIRSFGAVHRDYLAVGEEAISSKSKNDLA